MISLLDILSSKPIYEDDKERHWYVGHYRIKQCKTKHGDCQEKFFLYDRDSMHHNTHAFAAFHSKFYLSKFLDLMAAIQEIKI